MTILTIIAALIALGLIAAIAVRAIGGNIALVDDWKQAFRYYSNYGLLLVAMLPEVWNGLLQGGYLSGDDVGEQFSWAMKIGLAFTFIVRQIKQVKRPPLPDFSNPSASLRK